MPPERNTKKDLDNIQKAIDRKTAKDFRVVDGGGRWISSPKNIENVLAEIDDKISAGGAIKVYSAPSGDPNEVQVLNVNKLRFIQEYTPGGHHVVFDAGSGECWVGVQPPPLTLQGQNLITYPTKYIGGLSFSPTSTYKIADPAGSIINYITRGNSWNVSTPVACFGYASVGLLVLSLNGIDIAVIDLGVNFMEANRATGQIIAGYNTQGAGSPIAAGVVSFVGGQLQINSVAPASIPITDMYQRGSATITINGCLIEGYNILQLRHVVAPLTYTANLWECYEDTDPSGPANDPSVTLLDMSLNSLVVKWLSGVKHCGFGSQFDQDMTAVRVANNVYHSTLLCVLLDSFPGLSANYPTFAECGVAPFPNVGSTFQFVNRLVTLNVADAYSESASLVGTPRDPYGSYAAYVISKNILVNTYSSPSTSLWEPCVDENWRLPSAAYDTPPSPWTGNWDSTGDLNTYDTADGLQYRNNGVLYPEFNYQVGWEPSAGQPDYTPIWAANAPRWLWRGFRDNNISHSSGTIRLPGITDAMLAASQILVWIKVPTKTGWLRLHGTLYNAAGWTGVDNDPCRTTGGSGNDHKFTLATLGTNSASDWGIIIRIEIPNRTSPEITGAWGMIGW
jgi:hypothetical protein